MESIIATGVGWVLVSVIWAVNQSGRITTLEKQQEATKELFEVKLDSIIERLDRLERHVLNGHAKK